MSLPMKYEELSERLLEIRSWAGEISEGNRCALVLGATLRIRPREQDLTFRGLTAAKPNVRTMPFLERFFVKAQDLANAISGTHGPPDLRFSGASLLAFIKKNPGTTPIDGKRGVLFSQDSFKTKKQQALSKLGFEVDQTGDHIDLWDGNCSEIFKNDGRNAFVSSLMIDAEMNLFWRAS
ncbi:hypothetical protein LP7551_04880 [Roseibium album]|nr:hypothetical protein LP7551_04880 [Roseibium album]